MFVTPGWLLGFRVPLYYRCRGGAENCPAVAGAVPITHCMGSTSDQRRLARRLSWVVLALIAVLLTLLPVTAYRESSRRRTRVIEAPVYVPPVYPTTQSVTVADPSAVSLIAFGDWGRNSAAER